MERAQSGDVDAWELLYRRFHPRLYAFGRSRLPALHLVDDAVSETMSRAVQKLDGFTPHRSGFEGWLFGILRNVIHEHLRAFGPRDTHVIMLDSPPPDPLAGIVANEEQADMRTAFARLKDQEQELLALRSVARLSAADTGAVLGLSAGAVRTAQSRALRRLRTLFSEVHGGR